ncbi:MAG TPA: hypothetical protein VKZ53_09710 [Candidatus Angelobacter sp.]|nr:hypothetical protein [Candidatus Angelobacter sp.]
MSRKPPAIQVIFVDPQGTKSNGSLLTLSSNYRKIRALNDAKWDKPQTLKRFIESLQSRDKDGLEAAIRALNRHNYWRESLAQLRTVQNRNGQLGNALLSFWITYGSYSIPRALKEDLVHLIDTFKFLLPPYTGPGLTLYRGELEARHKTSTYGISWTPKVDVARMFANRRQPDEGQGVTLKMDAAPTMIIAALTQHSQHTSYLGEDEYLVDPREIVGKMSVVL